MKHIITNTSVIIKTNNYYVTILKKDFNTQIIDEPILDELSFSDLKVLWKDLYGVPINIKDILRKKIELHNSASVVKSFIYNDKEYWLDKENRNSLLNLSNSSLVDIDLVLGDEIISISPLKLKSLLLKLEDYSHKCFVNTSRHLIAIKDLKHIEDIINYDYTTGYPEKVILE